MQVEIKIKCRHCGMTLAEVRGASVEDGVYHIDIDPYCVQCRHEVEEQKRHLDIAISTAINNIQRAMDEKEQETESGT